MSPARAAVQAAGTDPAHHASHAGSAGLASAEGCALYVYYRVPAHQVEAARAALQAGLDRLAAAATGLHSRLLQRCPAPGLPEDVPAELTWMEIHERPACPIGSDVRAQDGSAGPQAGLDLRDRQLIATLLADLPPGRIGPRHEEWFGPV